MPRIIFELHGLEFYSWVTTAYLLTSTVTVPIWGKLGDLYGRKPVLVAGIVIFVLGSGLAGLSGEFDRLPVLGGGMTQLIAFRALQGIGAGALFTTAFAIIADLFPPRERGKVGGIFGAVFGLSSTLGPFIGGYFTDHGTTLVFGHMIAGWRWVFYLNLPLSLISLIVIIYKMPKMSHAAKGKIDLIGAALILATTVPLLLALTYGGASHPWGSPLVLGLFAGSAGAFGLYIFAERYASDPILPLALFKNRVFWTANLAGFFISMAFMSAIVFLPLFMQLGQGVQATASGLALLPLMVGLMSSSILSGRLVYRTGRYKRLILLGIVLTFVGIYLLSRMNADTTRVDLAWRMLVLGIGLGPGQSLLNLAMQNALPRDQVGVVTSASQFFRQIGSTIGVALFGTVLADRLTASLGRTIPGMDLGKLQAIAASAGASGRASLPPFAQLAVTSSITGVFAGGLIIVVAAAVFALLMPELPLRDSSQAGDAAPDSNESNPATTQF